MSGIQVMILLDVEEDTADQVAVALAFNDKHLEQAIREVLYWADGGGYEVSQSVKWDTLLLVEKGEA